MTDLPAAAITAATLALHEREGKCACQNADEHEHWLALDEADAKSALEAAAPHLTAADPTTESEGFRAWKAGVATGRAEGAAAERQRLLPPLRAMHKLYDVVWNQTATLDGDMPGYNLISYDDTNAIDEAGSAVEELLADGGFADLLREAAP